jgi:adenine-specific DNA methylase
VHVLREYEWVLVEAPFLGSTGWRVSLWERGGIFLPRGEQQAKKYVSLSWTTKMKARVSDQKLRGGYYTPSQVAHFLSAWAIRNSSDVALEPSCGDGEFVRCAGERLIGLGTKVESLGHQLVGCEIERAEADVAAQRLVSLGVPRAEAAVHCRDFFSEYTKLTNRRFDAVLGNPPFIRYQNFPEEQRTLAFKIMQSAGLRPNRLTNAWVPFVVAGTLLLKPGGRLAMVVPAELLQVNYASELRSFLAQVFQRITVVTFRRLAFEGIQQEVVLLLCEKKQREGSAAIELLELDDTAELKLYNPETFPLNGFKTLDHSAEKWTQYYLSQREINLLRQVQENPNLTRLGDIADTDIGIVTGMNDVFVISEQVARSTCYHIASLSSVVVTNYEGWSSRPLTGRALRQKIRKRIY